MRGLRPGGLAAVCYDCPSSQLPDRLPASGPPARFSKDELYAAIPEFVEEHWPKNDTAAGGGSPTPGRGEAVVMLARFVESVTG